MGLINYQGKLRYLYFFVVLPILSIVASYMIIYTIFGHENRELASLIFILLPLTMITSSFLLSFLFKSSLRLKILASLVAPIIYLIILGKAFISSQGLVTDESEFWGHRLTTAAWANVLSIRSSLWSLGLLGWARYHPSQARLIFFLGGRRDLSELFIILPQKNETRIYRFRQNGVEYGHQTA